MPPHVLASHTLPFRSCNIVETDGRAGVVGIETEETLQPSSRSYRASLANASRPETSAAQNPSSPARHSIPPNPTTPVAEHVQWPSSKTQALVPFQTQIRPAPS